MNKVAPEKSGPTRFIDELLSAKRRHPRIFISVAEQSADEHAAALVESFRGLVPKLEIAGLVGPALKRLGADCFDDLTARSAMAAAALRRVPESYFLLRRLRKYLAADTFDVAVLVDSPALNLPIAKICQTLQIPVLYYIAPQTWAWGPRRWRNDRVRKRVTRLACIWPFEERYFRDAGIAADFVGHPSFDRLLGITPTAEQTAAMKGSATRLITLLPGSRQHVVEEVLPGQLEVAQALAARFPHIGFVAVAANAEIQALIESGIRAHGRPLPIRIVQGAADRAAAIAAADLVLVASGTITLEVAYRGTPMLVMYNAGRWTYQLIGRWLITTPHLSIPNILAGKEIVPEFMPYYRNVDPIIAAAVEWLSTPGKLEKVRQDLLTCVRPIVKGGASDNAARILAKK